MGGMMPVRVGFVGVGTMGAPMARRLKGAGFETLFFARRQAVIETLQAEGLHYVQNLRDLAAQTDVVLMCLPDDAVVDAVGSVVLSAMKAGGVVVDHSTVSPYTSRRLAAEAKRRGISHLDAPISGGPMGAEAGTLAIMVGGEEEAFRRCHPLFEAMGRHIFYLGPSGAGNIAKLVNQLIIGITQEALVEGFVLGSRMGLDPKLLYDVLAVSTGESAMLHRSIPNCILQRDFTPKFTVDLLYKDLRLANDLGRGEGIRLLEGAVAEQVFREAAAEGLGSEDISALVKPLERQAGVVVEKRS
ncbi:3-hydroxyisobutyrate dehydrogenase [Kyrpidia tusciae DSM 2912]|uniref:3-hydroxyisobutyrate dehydrogenase n=2 Tax=Kyrpidia TaxID=1129704 RepID=D5WW47_KYRT2|nr:3-hydroxyisobutyrate dehydrogenase [Kyrpidia tusciae DSM 2912]